MNFKKAITTLNLLLAKIFSISTSPVVSRYTGLKIPNPPPE